MAPMVVAAFLNDMVGEQGSQVGARAIFHVSMAFLNGDKVVADR